jgi:hypothetical protein
MCCGWTLILSSFLGFCSLWNFSEHFRWNFGKFLDFFFYLLDFREHYDNIVSGQHVPTPVWVYIFDLSLSLQFYFDFIPTYVLFCMRPLPPPISVCSNWMCYSLFLEFGGEMLIDLTLSLCSLTPTPLHPSQNIHGPLYFLSLFPAFREHYVNICTFLRTFSCSISLLFVCANFYQFFANIMQTFGHFCKHFRAAFIIAPCLGSICPSQYMWISSDDALQYVFLC